MASDTIVHSRNRRNRVTAMSGPGRIRSATLQPLRLAPLTGSRSYNGGLVVLACSETKSIADGRIPAYERYDGPLWRTVRASDPQGCKSSSGNTGPIQHHAAHGRDARGRIEAELIRRWALTVEADAMVDGPQP
jgi:hypothetical protein